MQEQGLMSRTFLTLSLIALLADLGLGMLLKPKATSVLKTKQILEFELSKLLRSDSSHVTVAGNPRILNCPYGKAVRFDGVADGIFLDTNPLKELDQFTIEVLFWPDPEGPGEQRFVHMGEVDADRVMIETRLTPERHWYLDTFVKSAGPPCILTDKGKTHPAGKWYHIAVSVGNGKVDTYVSGVHELSGSVKYSPFKSGKMAVGVRMNQVSWFKGAIWKIRVTPKCLAPTEFLNVESRSQ
jgi:hypothetical protein